MHGGKLGGLMVSALGSGSSDPGSLALAGDIVLCSWCLSLPRCINGH